MDKIINVLQRIRDEKIHNEKKSGIGLCLMCKTFIDDPDGFICGHPLCDKEIREMVEKSIKTKEELDKLLKVLSVSSFAHAKKKIKDLENSAEKNEASLDKLFDYLEVTSFEEVEKKIKKLTDLVNEIEES